MPERAILRRNLELILLEVIEQEHDAAFISEQILDDMRKRGLILYTDEKWRLTVEGRTALVSIM